LRDKCSKFRDAIYLPNDDAVEVYKKLFSLYKDLHDAFGTREWNGNLSRVMKELIDIREDQR
ncbi:MAG: ribulokinase, partial [Verrucomicrobiota bacterium]|nr:ribulokinase [Verrucomicrobiota bacterium]